MFKFIVGNIYDMEVPYLTIPVRIVITKRTKHYLHYKYADTDNARDMKAYINQTPYGDEMLWTNGCMCLSSTGRSLRSGESVSLTEALIQMYRIFGFMH